MRARKTIESALRFRSPDSDLIVTGHSFDAA